MNMRVNWLVGMVMLSAVLILVGGCAKKDKPITTDTVGGGETASRDASPEPGLNENIDLSTLDFAKAPDLNTVYFDYDSFALRQDALDVLAANAATMKQKPSNTAFQIQGHCDERGTQEYNLALGEKRALAVREHLINLGVAGDRIVTISYGKERPADEGHDESAWKQNRRGEFYTAVIPGK